MPEVGGKAESGPFTLVAAAAAGAAIGIGAAALFGWQLGVTELIRVQPGLAAMRPNAAAGFMLAGLALLLFRTPPTSLSVRWVGSLAAAVVAALGAAGLLESLLGIEFGLDRLLYGAPADAGEGHLPVMSAISFLAIGIALLRFARVGTSGSRLAAALSVAVAALNLLTVIGYLYDVDALYEVGPFRSEALHSAVVFLVLAVGVAAARPASGVVRLLRSATGGGEVARRILPPVVLLPIALGWGVLRGAQLRGYEFEFGIALYTVGVIAVLATLVWGAARALVDADDAREKAEEELRRQEERHREDARFFHSVLDSLPDGVIATDADGRLILWNASADPVVRLAPHGAAPDERRAAYDAVQRDGHTPVLPEEFPVTRALAGETVTGFEMQIRAADPPTWISCSASPLRDRGGATVGAVSVFRDISEKRALEGQLYVADRLSSVGLLAAGVAHEINNPLAVATGNLQLIGIEVGESARATRMVSDAEMAAERIRVIVRDLKVLSRADSERRLPVDVCEVLAAAVRNARHELRSVATVEERTEPVPPVLANEARLGQVFLNLVLNAAQAIPADRADGRVTVGCRRTPEGRVEVWVTDNGVGIPAEHLPRLFTPFFTTKPIGEGSGLGLAISHRLIGDLGGTIEVESEPGRGSTFRVSLPAQAAPTRPRVLVVDDEPEIGRVVEIALAATHDVVCLTRGADAAALLERDERFDTILCDLNMPGLSGIELWSRLRQSQPHLADRMVFMTGGATTADSAAFLSDPGRRVVEKPFELATLRRTVGA